MPLLYSAPMGRARFAAGRVALSVLAASGTITARDVQLATAPGVLTADGLDRIVTAYLVQAEAYHEVFRNLVADEVKLIEVFDSTGKPSRQRRVISDLVVYSPSRSAVATAEYRDAREVDGKPVQRRPDRALKLVTDAASSATLEKELALINAVTRRYEFNSHWSGFTINQGGLLKTSRDAFRLAWEGRDRMANHPVIVIGYEQVAPLRSGVQPQGKQTQVYRGRLWLDEVTAQLRREEWEMTIEPPSAIQPLVAISEEATFVESPLGILVPERLVFNWFGHSHTPKNAPPTLSLRERTTFTYSAFRQFGVEVEQRTTDVAR